MPRLSDVREAVLRFTDESGLRFLARRRAPAAVAVLTIALALGVNAAAFSVVRAFLLSSLGIPDPDRVLLIAPGRDLPSRGRVLFNDAWPNYELLRATQHSFADVTCLRTLTGSWDADGDARALQMTSATASFFRTMQVAPFIGREFRPDEDGPGAAPVVLISHALWRSAFLADTAVLGKTMRINGAPLTIIGVMPEGFAQPAPTDVWVPFELPALARTSIAASRQLNVYGRLADGVSRRAADAEMSAFTARAIEASPDNRDFTYGLRPIRQVLLNGSDSSVLLVQAGALLLLVLAMVNLTSLLIAWGFDRQPELALRMTLGAPLARVARMLVAQAVVVVAAGAALGLVFAVAAVRWLSHIDAGPALPPFVTAIRVDSIVIATGIAVALAIGIAAGAAPVLLLRRSRISGTLRASGRTTTRSAGALRAQKTVVGVQAAVSVSIVTAAALVGLSFRNLMHVPNGFEPGQKVAVRIQLSDATYSAHGTRAAFASTLLDNLSREPALASYGFTTTLPVGDPQWGGRFVTELPDGSMMTDPLFVHLRRISPDYLTTLGLPLVQGRTIDAHDDGTHDQVALVSHVLAARLWPKGDAIGKFIYRAAPGVPKVPIQVVGVVGDAMDAGYNVQPGDAVYVPYAQWSAPLMSIVAEGRSTQTAAIAAVRHALKATDPVVAATNVATLETLVQQSNLLPRLQSMLLLAFAVVAAFMAGLGAYGVMNQLVANREREFGVRLAFGAEPFSNGRRVVVQLARLVVPGVVVGLVLLWVLSRQLLPFLFAVDPHALTVFAGAASGIIVLEALAALPAVRRAMRVDVRAATSGS